MGCEETIRCIVGIPNVDDEQVLRNLRSYVAMGGKLYVTDWSGEWMDNVFPAFITLGDPGTDTPAEAYDLDTNTWNTSLKDISSAGTFAVAPHGNSTVTWFDSTTSTGTNVGASALLRLAAFNSRCSLRRHR